MTTFVKITRVVFQKELREGLRDRRAFGSALLYGVFGPVVAAMALLALSRSGEVKGPLRVSVEGVDRAPSLVAFLVGEGVRLDPPPRDIPNAVRKGQVAVGLVITDRFARDFVEGRPASLRIVVDTASPASRSQGRRLQALLAQYAGRVASTRLLARGVSPAAVEPLRLSGVDVSTASSRAATALATLPMFLLLAAFVASMTLAIDATAGERERGSLEPLLLNPAPRHALAAGKCLAASTLAALGVLATLLVTLAVLASSALRDLELAFFFGPREASVLFALLLPIAFLAPAVQMAAALFAKSFKEAQSYLSLLLFVPMVPGFLIAFGGAPQNPSMRLLPLVGHQMLIAEVLRGESPRLPVAAVLTLGTLGLAALATMATGYLLSRERMVAGS